MIEHAGALAAAIVNTALELVASSAPGLKAEVLLASPTVRAALPERLHPNGAAQVQLLNRLAIHLAREVLNVWTAVHPDDHAPEQAVAAAEVWAACPCRAHADAAAATGPAAVQTGLSAWTLLPKTAAWAARTAAWAAHAPRNNWQAVAAITGACKATSVERVVDTATAWLGRQ